MDSHEFLDRQGSSRGQDSRQNQKIVKWQLDVIYQSVARSLLPSVFFLRRWNNVREHRIRHLHVVSGYAPFLPENAVVSEH